MATPFEKVYSSFLSHIKDYSLMELYDKDEVAFKEEMFQLLNNALVNYTNPSVDLFDYNRDMEEFNNDLKPYEIVILGKLMAIEYLNPIILDEALIKQSLNSKDYRAYSPQKHLEGLQKQKDKLHNEVNRAMSRQSYSVENLEKSFGKKK